MRFDNEVIWIIGASSGIGKALTIALSKYNVELILSARNSATLKSLQQQIGEQRSAIYPLDIADAQQVSNVCDEITKTYRIDRVIFMAALYQPTLIQNIDFSMASKIIDTNLKGAIYLCTKLVPIMAQQKFSQIALCASVAGYIGLPNGQPYSASKAALINFSESLYCENKGNIDIKLINPGFVKTPMTNLNTFNMPMIISAECAANHILKGLESRKFEISFPKKFTLLMKLLSIMPYSISLKISHRFN